VNGTGGALSWDGPLLAVPDSLVARVRQAHPLATQLVRYAAVGGLGTAANAVLFLGLRIWWEALPANLVALVLSTLISTEVNRRFTFGAALPTHRWRAHVQSGGAVAFYAVYSSAVLITLGMLVDEPSPWLQTLAIATASVVGGVGRYLVLRFWVFEEHAATPDAPDTTRRPR
jgi:putative flippase GtrA